MKTFESILAYHTGYSEKELKERTNELLLKPYDVILAFKEYDSLKKT